MPVLTRSMTKYINADLEGRLVDTIHRYMRSVCGSTEFEIQDIHHIHRQWERAEAVNRFISHSPRCQSVNMKVYIYSFAERNLYCEFRRWTGWMIEECHPANWGAHADKFITPHDLVHHVEKENEMMTYVKQHGWVKC